MDAPATIADLFRLHVGDDRLALRFEDSAWTHREVLDAVAARAAFLLDRKPVDGPFHVGVLFDNIPEFWFALGACAFAGATLVGINPTRRGGELARDVHHTDCALLLTERSHVPLLAEAGDVVASDQLFVVDEDEWPAVVAPYTGAPLPDVPVAPDDTFMLIFTSGTTGAPKAVKMGHGRLTGYGSGLAANFGLGPDDACYSVMPLFHSNAAVAGFASIVASGAVGVLRRRFSASGWLDDVRSYGVTFFNYVGKPLTYILATPARPDDADNPLKFAFGNEAAPLDIDRFAARFGCYVADGYGSTEGGINMSRTPETPKGALGRPVVEGIDARIVDPETGIECPRAKFDEAGRFLNADDAIGEIVNVGGAGGFEGYYKNDEANAERMRDGKYWTGDLGYRDEDGFFYFAGRNSDWLRVDGENFAAAPVENVLSRHPHVVLAAVFAVPAIDVGDDVMAALHLREGTAFDPDEFTAFLGAQSDLSPKWVPRFLRISTALPSTATQKVLKRVLRREHWECEDVVWWRPPRASAFQRLTPADVDELRRQFAARGRDHLLGR
jgi:acyl-CoA synthetase (AMP-forming)/AMP-acid ligase II